LPGIRIIARKFAKTAENDQLTCMHCKIQGNDAIIAIGFTPGIYYHKFQINHPVFVSSSVILIITFPFMLAGGLFIISHFLKKERFKSGVKNFLFRIFFNNFAIDNDKSVKP
jgi:hypothetical protein